jgi:hypothetical protein
MLTIFFSSLSRPLCLARASDGTAGCACGGRVTIRRTILQGLDLAASKSSDVGDLSVFQGSCSFATGGSLSVFLVSREVE